MAQVKQISVLGKGSITHWSAIGRMIVLSDQADKDGAFDLNLTVYSCSDRGGNARQVVCKGVSNSALVPFSDDTEANNLKESINTAAQKHRKPKEQK